MSHFRVELAVVRGPGGLRTDRHYNADGSLLKTEIGERTTYRLIQDGDHVEIAVNERGGRTRTVYDANGNPVKTVYPDGTARPSSLVFAELELRGPWRAAGVHARTTSPVFAELELRGPWLAVGVHARIWP